MWKSILTTVSLIAAAFAGVVTFSGNLVTLRDNISKLFFGESAKITLTNATSIISKDAPSSLIPVRFTVVVEHENKDVQCSGEGSGIDAILSSKEPKVSIAEGKQSKIITLEIPPIATKNFKYDLLNGAVAGLVGIGVGVVSGVINLESSGVEASDWRLRHDQAYHEA
jgi:hypothetical protein